MNWIPLTVEAQLDTIIEKSATTPQLIFKHSTSCSISSTAKNRLDKGLPADAGIDYYYLDLLAHRPLSAQIAARFHVQHESPQVLVIKKGICTYNESHLGIRPGDVVEEAKSA